MLTKEQIQELEIELHKRTGVLIKLAVSFSDKDRILIINEAMRLVNEKYGVDVRSKKSNKKYNEARHMFVFLLKNRIKTNQINVEIGEAIKRDRTTVTNSHNQMKVWVKYYANIALDAEILGKQLDEFIKIKIFNHEKSN